MSAVPTKTNKCDGEFPCGRCQSRGETCNYQDRVWRTKDDLRSEISKLQDGVGHIVALLESISSGETDRQALDQLRQGETVQNIIETLGNVPGDTSGARLQEKLQALVSNTRRNDAENDAEMNGGSSRTTSPDGMSPEALLTQALEHRVNGADDAARGTYAGQEASRHNRPPQIEVPNHASLPRHNSSSASGAMEVDEPPESPNRIFERMYGGSVPPLTLTPGPSPGRDGEMDMLLDLKWNAIPSDSAKVMELMNIFFDWDATAFSAVVKEPFMRDLAARRRRYCSEALVNAIMARSYQMLQNKGESVPKDTVLGLYRKAQSLLTIERNLVETPIPLIQALSVLTSIDTTMGRLDKGWTRAFETAESVIRAFGDGTDSVIDEYYVESRANTFCGALTLAYMVRIVGRQLEPAGSPLFMQMGTEEESMEDKTARGMKLQKMFFEFLPLCPARTRFVWETTNLVHGYLMYHCDDNTVNDKMDLFEYYPQCISAWNRAKSEFNMDGEMTPSNLASCHQFHWTLILLFRPYIGDQSLEPALSPRKILADSCRTIIQLAWHQKVTWGLGFCNIGFPLITGLATEVWVSLTRPAAMALDADEPGWAAAAAGSAEVTGKAVMVLNELAPHHFPAKNSLDVVNDIYARYDQPVTSFLYTQGTRATIDSQEYEQQQQQQQQQQQPDRRDL